MKIFLLGVLLLGAPFCCQKAAFAQNAITMPEMMRGQWVALHHSSDGGAHTDACILKGGGPAFELRVTLNGRAVDRTVSTEADAETATPARFVLTAGAWTRTFSLGARKETRLQASLSPTELDSLLDGLGKGESLSLELTGAAARTVALTDIQLVLGSFRHCIASNGLAGKPK